MLPNNETLMHNSSSESLFICLSSVGENDGESPAPFQLTYCAVRVGHDNWKS